MVLALSLYSVPFWYYATNHLQITPNPPPVRGHMGDFQFRGHNMASAYFQSLLFFLILIRKSPNIIPPRILLLTSYYTFNITFTSPHLFLMHFKANRRDLCHSTDLGKHIGNANSVCFTDYSLKMKFIKTRTFKSALCVSSNAYTSRPHTSSDRRPRRLPCAPSQAGPFATPSPHHGQTLLEFSTNPVICLLLNLI